jgi:anti-sigma regulatory factor (Ser/Thr protein kinase)
MRTFPAIPQSVHAARRFAVDALADMSPQSLEAVELMVSELATNCIRHERTSFHVAVIRTDPEVRVEVTDSGEGTPTMRTPGPDEPSGRGLQIVDMLSEHWGVQPEAPSGKTVWFTLELTAPRAARLGRAASEQRYVADPAGAAGRPAIVQQGEAPPEGPTSLSARGFCGPRGHAHGIPARSASQAVHERGRYFADNDDDRPPRRRVCRPAALP